LDNDIELVESARNGEVSAFRKLVEQNKRHVYNLAYDLTGNREDAEDISQDVFIKAFRSLNKFRGDAKFSTWIYRITVNTCYSFRRKKSYTAMQPEENMEQILEKTNNAESQSGNPERKFESVQIKENIELALMKLSKREKSVFILRNFNELAFDEIVSILRLRPGTVRSLNFRAIKKLRKELSFYKYELHIGITNE
jgi:RNA polymerase sigma-70 factor (ECF subfamily)